jgi:omega-amidase
MKSIKIALCQILPGFDKHQNVKHAVELIEQAADKGAELVALPEIFYYPYDLQSIKKLAGDEQEILDLFKDVCVRKQIVLCTGSMVTKEDGKYYNTSFLIDRTGEIVLSYRKCHLYDVKFKGLDVQESSVFSAGNRIDTAKTSLGNISIIICYDIRFPEISRLAALAGAELLIVPADFNQISGPAHWEVMMRARAIENQVFLAAVSQAKNKEAPYKVYGHSMIISPWGDVIAEAGDGEEIIIADLDGTLLENIRNKLPLLKHIRKDMYSVQQFSI